MTLAAEIPVWLNITATILTALVAAALIVGFFAKFGATWIQDLIARNGDNLMVASIEKRIMDAITPELQDIRQDITVTASASRMHTKQLTRLEDKVDTLIRDTARISGRMDP